ncbi:MAG: cytochrome c family protein [Desulfobacteraceae bacterium]|jgi:hypothetical protein
MKKTVISLLTVLLTISFAGSAMAIDRGNKRKGKYTYRKVYSACFERGEVTSKKPPLSPDTKTQAQWTQVFEKKEFDQFGCKQEWSQLGDKDLSDIYTYLHDHAADSPTPAKCK